MTELFDEQQTADGITFPATLPVLPLKETVVFPESMTPLAIGQERSIKLVEEAVAGERSLALVTVRNEEADPPGWDDLYAVGTAAIVHKMIRVPDGTLRILVQGLRRIRLERRVQTEPYLVGEFVEVPDVLEESREVEALTRNVQGLFARVIGLVPYLPEELQIAAANVEDPSALCNLVASTLRLKTEEKQMLLELDDVHARLRETSAILSRELEVFELGSRIQSQVQEEMEKGQREFYLRQQLKAIQEELGEGDPEQAEITELRARFEELDLSEEARKAADRELARLEKLPPVAAEYGVIRTYLDWLVTLPWGKTTPDNLDLDQAKRILDEDHFDLEKVKERILEYLAVSKLKNDLSGPILCFVGPPGVGKTSLGQSIARTLGRNFQRLSVGGVRDEAEIRGHRRTYIGAMPGTIIRTLRDAESLNPVLLIDEIDKMGSDFRGDPASAMLEVLDPEQNKSFRDHYLDLPFDLSKVLFICTANTLDTIPPPLLDRMDVIHLSGYTEDEKFGIAKKYLVPKQLEAHGLGAGKVTFTDNALRLIIREYTREAGVRNLERQIAAVLRKAARQVAEGTTRAKTLRLDERRIRSALGPRRFAGEVRKRTADPGVATGLAFTAIGGDVLFIEATAYPGKGRLTITGQLGDVMQESAQAALSWVRSHAEKLGVDPEWFAQHDVHIHVPAGAVPKDGPSAGITIATAIASLVRGEPVSEDVGMTGEITLTGQVLPIGGVREKTLAAQRAGLKRVVLPRENEPDLEELPTETKRALDFTLVDSIDEVFDAAFDGRRPARPKPAVVRDAAARSA
ncbi:MAG TPA: endopeptidase La [Gaiellaceae bacterium]|jgi:ATP-dependent Lon protease|nr:endopeptidase La [Gaiellaceae bacterium]